MTTTDDLRRDAAARELTPIAVTHLTRDALGTIDFAKLAPVKQLLKRFFSAEPYTPDDERSLAELVGPGNGWWQYDLDPAIAFGFGWRAGEFRLTLTPRASLEETFDGPVVPEATPNPRSIRFVTGPIHDGPSRWYESAADADDPRAARLFADFEAVTNVLVGPDFVAVGLRRPEDWERLLDPILRAVTAEFASGGSAPTPDATGAATIRGGAVRASTSGENDHTTALEVAWRELGSLRADQPADLEQLVAAATATAPAFRQVAARLLIEADTVTAEQQWTRMLDDESRSVRRATVDAVVDAERPALRALLERALGDPDAWIRWKALRGLVNIGMAASRSVVAPLTADPDFRVRLEAAGALARSCLTPPVPLAEDPPRDQPAGTRRERETQRREQLARRRGRWWTVGIVLVYLVLGVLLFWPVWRHDPGSRTPLGADQGLSIWFLAWTPKAILHGHNPLFSNFANFPGGVSLLDNTGLTLLGVIGTPITLIFGPIATANVMLTAGPALSATAAYFLIRRFTSWRPAAFAGGLLYGFSPFVILHSYIHINFTFDCLPPLILLALHELVVRQRSGTGALRCGVLLGALVAAQFFVSSEMMSTTIAVGVTAVVIAAVVGRRWVRARVGFASAGIAAAAVTAAVLLAYPVWFLLRGPAHVVGPIQLTPQAYRADLLGLFEPGPFQLIATRGMQHTASHFANMENGSYLGIPLVAVTVAGAIWLRRRAVVVVAALTAVVVFVLSLGGALAVSAAPASNVAGDAVGRVPLPEALLAKLPLLHNIIPARFAMYVALLVGIVLACVLDHAHESLGTSGRGRRWRIAVPAAIAVISLVPLLPAASPITVGTTGTPSYFTTAAVHAIPPGSVAVVYPYPSGAFPDASLWQALADFRFRMPGGYFRVPQPPTGHIAFTPLLGYTQDTMAAEVLVNLGHGNPPPRTSALRQAVLTQFATWNVQSFIAVPSAAAKPRLALAFLTWLLGPPNAHHDSAYVWTNLEPGSVRG